MNTTTKAQWIAQNLSDYAAMDAAQAAGNYTTGSLDFTDIHAGWAQVDAQLAASWA